MSGVKDRLDYLEETKNLIKEAIVTSGGTLSDESTFREYPEQIQYIIDHSIIPQSVLDELIEKSNIINGEEVSN